MRLYDVHFASGSVERLEADDIIDAREAAKALCKEAIVRVVFVAELDPEEPGAAVQETEAEDNSDAEEDDDEEEDGE